MCGVDLVERTLSGEGDAVVPMEIGVTVDADAIEFRILEHGIPLGSRTGDGPGGDIPDRIRPSTVFDRLWWVQKGQEGSELHLRADRDHASMELVAEQQPSTRRPLQERCPFYMLLELS